jgi:hypothetical protein
MDPSGGTAVMKEISRAMGQLVKAGTHFSRLFRLDIHLHSPSVIPQYRVRATVFNATFNNISVISCRSVLLVEETCVPVENQRPATSH